jgi:hypothetical protein
MVSVKRWPMNAETLRVSLQQACDPLPPPSQQVVRRFFRLAEEEGSLQLYLEQLLPTLCSLLHATAGMVWLRAAASPDACFAIRHRMETLGWDDAMSKRHDRLVQIAWQQRQPMLVEPTSRRKGSDATPQWRLAFAPICHQQAPFAMLELVLDAQVPLMQARRQAILKSLQGMVESLQEGLTRRLRLPQPTIAAIDPQLTQLELEIASYQQTIQRIIKKNLAGFQGWSFGSLGENQEFAKRIQKLLEDHGLRAACPECGHPAILRCLQSGNSRNGVFVFDHYLATGRTFHGGASSFPDFGIVPKPQRKSS